MTPPTNMAAASSRCIGSRISELVRLPRPGGLLYVNAPSNHAFHRYPVDCWRFYPDAGAAPVEWGRRRGVEVELVESFVARPAASGWADFVAVFRRPGPPLVRLGRLAGFGETRNGFDAESTGLLRDRAETFDMLALAQAQQQLQNCERERDELRAQAASASGELGKACEAILALNQESEALRREPQTLRGQPSSGT